ncbi:MAG TPA: hypothetical protein VEB42_10425, partial [Chitinophagaceae bacterium]|nr:hypothetical protein [Chitinophagaceae bacterium]
MAKVPARIFIVMCFCSTCFIAIANSPVTDSVIEPASLKYSRMNFFKRILLGTNYRREWAKPVKMPVFDIKKVNGGFTIEELGGGQQTKSLRLKAKDGQEWVLRTVDKDVDK